MGNTGAAVAQTPALPDCYEVGALRLMGMNQRPEREACCSVHGCLKMSVMASLRCSDDSTQLMFAAGLSLPLRCVGGFSRYEVCFENAGAWRDAHSEHR